MKNRKILIVSGVILLVLAAAYYFYFGFLYKEARDITAEAPAYTLTAPDIVEEYQTNAATADSMYLNKTIVVIGNVNDNDSISVSLEPGVYCSFDVPAKNIIPGKNIKIKGRCIGFDELFGEVKLDQCTINQ
ncbi:hypothetical protein GN157_01140 [Flavobacterium rakeshii]|uniref:tRNA_anti-like n=1 Tax=Flavobacterium rakeshii TaxID=1038845 RepID=A0A6N8H8Q4_9FLAO|nr:hypothetical protein [Flavobacterium rakeshii]MUV02303.1 hypothetical protein [Flavobacterium rakeshii]